MGIRVSQIRYQRGVMDQLAITGVTDRDYAIADPLTQCVLGDGKSFAPCTINCRTDGQDLRGRGGKRMVHKYLFLGPDRPVIVLSIAPIGASNALLVPLL